MVDIDLGDLFRSFAGEPLHEVHGLCIVDAEQVGKMNCLLVRGLDFERLGMVIRVAVIEFKFGEHVLQHSLSSFIAFIEASVGFFNEPHGFFFVDGGHIVSRRNGNNSTWWLLFNFAKNLVQLLSCYCLLGLFHFQEGMRMVAFGLACRAKVKRLAENALVPISNDTVVILAYVAHG